MSENAPDREELQARKREYRAELAAFGEASGVTVRAAYSVGDRGVDVGLACLSLADLRKLMQAHALPDRETIDIAVDDAMHAKCHVLEPVSAADWARLRDSITSAVLALFGQEGQHHG